MSAPPNANEVRSLTHPAPFSKLLVQGTEVLMAFSHIRFSFA